MIVEVSGTRAEKSLDAARRIHAVLAKTGIRIQVIVLKIQGVLDERSAGKCVITHPVAADPGIDQRQGKQEEENENALGFASAGIRQGCSAILLH